MYSRSQWCCRIEFLEYSHVFSGFSITGRMSEESQKGVKAVTSFSKKNLFILVSGELLTASDDRQNITTHTTMRSYNNNSIVVLFTFCCLFCLSSRCHVVHSHRLQKPAFSDDNYNRVAFYTSFITLLLKQCTLLLY